MIVVPFSYWLTISTENILEMGGYNVEGSAATTLFFLLVFGTIVTWFGYHTRKSYLQTVDTEGG
ncbi:hypothetical protein ACLI4Y_08025 [Natrialbaceae archaeon A-CW3]